MTQEQQTTTAQEEQKSDEAADSQGIRIFVYGTLKRGHYNHPLLAGKETKFLGRDVLEGPYTMLDLRFYPGVIRQESNPTLSRRLYGEVYRINEETLDALDLFEGNGNFFTRKKVPTRFKNAWAYFIPESYIDTGKDIIQQGCWRPLEDEAEFVSTVEKGAGVG